MKKILIGTIVGAIIYFAYQCLMWIGGFYNDFSTFTVKPDALLMSMSSNLLAVLLVSLVIFHGNFTSFSTRFLVSMSFGTFALVQGSFNGITLSELSWSFIKPMVLDLILGWVLCSAWLAWYMKKADQN